jgi:hypothetical protein
MRGVSLSAARGASRSVNINICFIYINMSHVFIFDDYRLNELYRASHSILKKMRDIRDYSDIASLINVLESQHASLNYEQFLRENIYEIQCMRDYIHNKII